MDADACGNVLRTPSGSMFLECSSRRIRGHPEVLDSVLAIFFIFASVARRGPGLCGLPAQDTILPSGRRGLSRASLAGAGARNSVSQLPVTTWSVQ